MKSITSSVLLLSYFFTDNKKRTAMELIWKWQAFNELTTEELYTILKLRQEIFVIEQQCIYLDCDNLDKDSYHLTGWKKGREGCGLVAYLRVIHPKKACQLPRIGRLLVHAEVRQRGIGNLLISKALKHINLCHPGIKVHISAQAHLIDFYEAVGFQVTSDIYEEDNIPHIDMAYSP
jgi:ElaA protein